MYFQVTKKENFSKNKKHDNILNKTYSPFDVFDEYGCYLALDFKPEDLLDLKKESYRLSVKLLFGESQYEIFSQADSLLIVR